MDKTRIFARPRLQKMATYKKRGYKPKTKGEQQELNVKESTTAEVFSTLDSGASKTELWVSKNQTYILSVIGIIAVGVLAYLGYQQFIQNPKEASASNELFYPLQYFSQAQQNPTQADSLYTMALEGAGVRRVFRNQVGKSRELCCRDFIFEIGPIPGSDFLPGRFPIG